MTKNTAAQQRQDGVLGAQADSKGWKPEDAGSVWREAPLPANPRERRTIRNQLIVLALAALVAHLISLMSR